MGECFQWKAHGQCSKGDSCSFSHDKLVQGDLYGGQRRKGRSSSPAPNSKAKTAKGQNHLKNITQQSGMLFRQKERNSVPLQECFKKKKKRHVKFGHPLVCQTTSLRPDANFVEHVSSDMLRLRKKPSKKSKKGGAKGSVALLKDATQFGCVSQDSYPRKSIPREEGKMGSRHAVRFSKGTWHQNQIRERKGPSRGIIQKCESHECSLCAQNPGIDHMRTLCTKKDALLCSGEAQKTRKHRYTFTI